MSASPLLDATRPEPAVRATPLQTQPPLFVDLDGTLIATDTLFESALGSAKRRPLDLWKWPLWLASGRAVLKSRLADSGSIDAARLPYRESLCEYLREQRRGGRRVYLATAADRTIAQAVADHTKLFDGVIASDGRENLKGKRKLEAIRRLHAGSFVYVGNAPEDLPIWQQADGAIVVDSSASLLARARDTGRVERVFPRETNGWTAWFASLRPHQWIKNVLVFVPLLTSFQYGNVHAMTAALTAFVAFCLCASATYIVNDLLDLDADRAHPRKRLRPFAAGTVSVPCGLASALLLALTGLGLALWHSTGLAATVLCYMAVTTAYSVHIKGYVLLDSIVLAGLYTARIFGGAVATGIEASVWLMGFSLFLFLSLALLKRCAELVVHESAGIAAARGRDYRVSDLRVLWPMGVAMSFASVVVFVLYASDAAVRARFGSPTVLWLVAVGLVYWLGRLWLKTSRGEMSDDPIVFALRDRGSRLTIFAMVLMTIAAHQLTV